MLNPESTIPGASHVVGDFWSWAYSDILSNTNRGVFAEFLVGAALRIIDQPRIEWDAVDFRYQGRGIEVKSVAYLQSWKQTKPSIVAFDIAPKKGWDSTTNVSATESLRSADIYVFCLFAEQDPTLANVLDTQQWDFYVVPAETFNTDYPTQKKISLDPLRRIASAVSYADLKQNVDSFI